VNEKENDETRLSCEVFLVDIFINKHWNLFLCWIGNLAM